MTLTVVAEYQKEPSEGINVVSKTLIDDLRSAGQEVRVIAPEKIMRALPNLVASPSALTVFTHGPGIRTIAASRLLRLFGRTGIVWVATRPDIASCPSWLKGWRSAHHVICNRKRQDLMTVAPDTNFIEQPIGIAPERLLSESGEQLWPELRARGVPLAVHIGHLRRNRGLDRLIKVKELLGDRIEIAVLASPRFPPEPGIREALAEADIHVASTFVANISDVYHSSDLYLFPTSPEQEGAIELPLSVLEAIACNKPVVTTEFGALPKALAGVRGVKFAECEAFPDAVAELVNGGITAVPDGLPENLNAHRLAEIILDLARNQQCKN